MKSYKYLSLLAIVLLSSCGKEFLEIKQNKSQVIPKSIKDLQALLDDATNTINFFACNELGLIGSDDYFVSDMDWAALSPIYDKPYERKGYYWAEENVYENQGVRDWDYTYKKILVVNTILEGIEKIKPSISEMAAWNNVKGSALFIRAFAFYQLAQEFCGVYDLETANIYPGIPLRLKADITAKVSRGTLSETYRQIFDDLKLSGELLPNVPLINFRPSKPAVYTILARMYLQMGNYDEAGRCAGLCLQLKNNLINFNSLNLNAEYSFPVTMQDNPEIIYASYIAGNSILQTYKLRVAPSLYLSYAEEDLGKKAYFTKEADGGYSFKGSYYGNLITLFTGLAVDEVLLMRAECYTRTGKLSLALDDLNYLLINRYNAVGYKKLAIANKDELLDEILEQRRKRLILRGTRWEDLRRLNKENRYKKTLVRVLNGIRYELPPGDIRYTWPIPEKAAEFGAYLQNPR